MTTLIIFRIRLFSLAVVALALTGCALPPQHTHEYSCPDGYEFTVRFSGEGDPGDVALLEDASGAFKLPRSPSASGERYSNGVMTFWAKADTAMIQRGKDVVHADCTR